MGEIKHSFIKHSCIYARCDSLHWYLGYVMRTAFRRVYALLFAAVFKYVCHVFPFTLGQFQCLYFDRHLVSCLVIMPKDDECPEEPNIVSLGTFDDLKAYFDQKFSHLKRELSDDVKANHHR